uniref:Uncharacterized protein n=1 Tax=Pseudomonas aeruginosa TaxID=287 RepID=A0A2L1KI41_PSEAI|nr:Hypothetical protein [Pseudomonas aeruginosa]
MIPQKPIQGSCTSIKPEASYCLFSSEWMENHTPITLEFTGLLVASVVR